VAAQPGQPSGTYWNAAPAYSPAGPPLPGGNNGTAPPIGPDGTVMAVGPAGVAPGQPYGPLQPGAATPWYDPVVADPTVDLEAIVREARTGRLMIGAGVTSDAGLVGHVVIDEQNFDWRRFPTGWDDIRNGTAWRGAGQRFRVEAMPGTHVQRYLASFQEPYLWDTPISFGLSGFFFDRRYFDWDEERLGGRVSLGYQFPRDWAVAAALRLENVEVSNPRVLPPVPEVAAVLGDNTLVGAKLSLVHDTRDNAFLPTQGHMFELGLEQVFGSFEYPIATLEARKFFTLRERINASGRHVLNVGGQVGFSGSDTPVYDRFYAGGYSTIRGFAFRGASPRNGDVIVGGTFQLLGTVEYMLPLTADDMLRAVVFVDAGTVEDDVRLETDNFRVAPGVGLRIAHPGLGPAPIALDLAFPVAHMDGDSIRNFSFFIGVRY
jgi:outer membrane protein insertion porin family